MDPKDSGVVAQLVRIHAYHAWGRGFESSPHRQKSQNQSKKAIKQLNFNELIELLFSDKTSKNSEIPDYLENLCVF